MPIRPENKALYPKNWQEIRVRIRARAGNRCERCGAENHRPHPVTGALVVCTTMHLDHNPANCADDNLQFACQKCHNGYDAKHRVETRRRNHDR